MPIKKWCESAQKEQFNGKNHLHANFRHSLRMRIMPQQAVNEFKAGLGSAPPARSASEAVAMALQENLKANPPRPDFRFLGNSVPSAAGSIFVNLLVELVPNSASGPGVGAYRRYSRKMIWLTTQDAVVDALNRVARLTPSRDISKLAFFREMVHLLGLKAKPTDPLSEDFVAILRLGTLMDHDALRRPHALSTGYDDRFCGASAVVPFGSTTDNRTGEAGLPEAICLAENVSLFSEGPDYEAFRARLAPLASWIKEGEGPIQATLRGNNLFEVDVPYYPTLQTVIIRRLAETKAGCGKQIGNCYC